MKSCCPPARYGGQYLYDEPDHQNAVHLVQTIEAMGYGSLSPTALQRFLSTRRADASVSFTALHRGGRRQVHARRDQARCCSSCI